MEISFSELSKILDSYGLPTFFLLAEFFILILLLRVINSLTVLVGQNASSLTELTKSINEWKQVMVYLVLSCIHSNREVCDKVKSNVLSKMISMVDGLDEGFWCEKFQQNDDGG